MTHSLPNTSPEDVVDDIIDQNFEAIAKWKGRRLRAQHGRSHGCVKATFTIRDDLPERLRHGLFEKAESYSAAVRFSNGAHLDDRKTDAHGMAVKLFDVPGTKLIDVEALSQLNISQISDEFDFVLVDRDTFPSYLSDDYERLSSLIATLQALQHAANKRRSWSLKLITRGLVALFRAFATQKGRRRLQTASDFASNYMQSPFEAHFWSTTPYRLGTDLTVRYLARSVRHKVATKPVDEHDGISLKLRQDVASDGNRFEFCIIEPPRNDGDFDPLDNRVRWACDPQPDAPLDPFHRTVTPIADITIEKDAAFDPLDGDTLSFSPWRVTAEHKPLGPINAIRLKTYLSLARARFPNR
ncbi:hypothetical protein K3740_19290 (plasmid) [Ruegeria conchae]|uniref:hypothetical protein n=1 Tax=Ruegeria conchae TaxID=981384 RepID=UPI00147E4621|nr:hypothetical protein [Ruegeria conchae]UWR05419.1 hypothetical protein K3740_19290 [Ruegeria conchae]